MLQKLRNLNFRLLIKSIRKIIKIVCINKIFIHGYVSISFITKQFEGNILQITIILTKQIVKFHFQNFKGRQNKHTNLNSVFIFIFNINA